MQTQQNVDLLSKQKTASLEPTAAAIMLILTYIVSGGTVGLLSLRTLNPEPRALSPLLKAASDPATIP